MATAAESVEPEVEEDETTEPDETTDRDETLEEEPADEEPVALADRCEAVTTVGGTEYRCALNAEHGDEHKFQPVAEETAPEFQFDPKALDRETARHERALEKVYGPTWEERTMCPLCVGEGYLTPLPAGAMPPELWDAVTALAGQMPSADLQNDEDYVVCQNCAGWGQTLIKDSKREGLSKQCDRCLGLGYVKTTNVTQLPNAYTIPGPTDLPATPTHASYGAPGPDDQWGRPTGHAHYGIPPAAVT